MRYKFILTFGIAPAFIFSAQMVGAAPLLTTQKGASFAPLSPSSSHHPASSHFGGRIILTQSSDAFPPLGFDPAHPEKTAKQPERSPIWPVSPAVPETEKPGAAEPFKLMQPPKPAPAPSVQPGQPKSAAKTARPPAYPSRQPARGYPAYAQPVAPYGYGLPRPPGFDWNDPGRNPWAQGNRNSWVSSGNNSWSKAGRNSWSKTGRNTMNTNRQNPWAAPNKAVNRPQYYRGRVPYYGQRQPVFAPRYANPWDSGQNGAAKRGGYPSQFAPLYRPRDTRAEAKPTPPPRTGIYPDYYWRPPAPWYGGPARIR